MTSYNATIGVTTASEKIEIRARPPDHIERRNVPSQLLASVVSSPSERSASLRPSPTSLLSQGRVGSVVKDCSRLRYCGKLSMKYASSLMMMGTVKAIKSAIAVITTTMMTSVATSRFIPSRSMRLATGSSRYASTIPATNGNRTSRNKATTAMTAASIAIQNRIGRVKFMIRQLDPRVQRITADAMFARDHEYKRHGTVSLLAGIDLLTGKVHALVKDRHRSREFIEFLKLVDTAYPADTAIHLILDNHSAHISRETRAWLAEQPAGRFEFTFTPKHGSWLNLVEGFFSKLARSVLRHIRVSSKQELKQRLMAAVDYFNRDPVVHTWTYKLDKAA